MLNLINWQKPLMVNGMMYANSDEAIADWGDDPDEDVEIILNPKPKATAVTPPQAVQEPKAALPDLDTTLFRVKVKKWMRDKATPDFDFMAKRNNNIPMPLTIMVGKVLERTATQVKMELHGRPSVEGYCIACGKKLTHKVSLLYGIGPECGGHAHINPYKTEAELNANFEKLKATLADITWTGWIPKSAIKEFEEVE